jgi:CRP-like cAMP-binding protein
LQFRAGQVVFARGELARTQAYLIEGDIELQSEKGTEILRAGSEAARHPLAPGHRRSATALCLRGAQVLFVDSDLLDVLLTWSQTGGLDANSVRERASLEAEIEDDGIDWMTSLLQSKAFLRVPPGNIAQIFASMEAVSFSPGQVIIKQGAPGDYYYVVTDGRVQVVIEDKDGRNEEEVAQLGAGKAFGEEAIVSGAPRNASVRALTRCTLMRLSSTNFMRLLRAPLMHEVQLAEHAGQALLDVRVRDEYDHGHLPGALNLPLAQLRERSKQLDSKLEYWIYCDTGRRSASATFLLSERGFNAKWIKGGVAIEALSERNAVDSESA